jgi:hypothetical protein
MSMIWESIHSSRAAVIKRARVSSGWLVASPYDGDRPGEVTYYHDPTHDWDGVLLDL